MQGVATVSGCLMTFGLSTAQSTNAIPSYCGLAPGLVGLYQVNVTVPAGTPTGNAVPVSLSVGGVAGNAVAIAVR